MKNKNLSTFYKPYTPSRRFMSKEDTSEITSKKPYKKLLKKAKKVTGRDKLGHISIYHRGGGQKRKYRIISSLQNNINKPAKVLTIEYDPNRTARIMLVEFDDRLKQYLIAPSKIKVNDIIIASEKTKLKIGNRMKLKNIPIGTDIYDIEIQPDSRGKLVRSAGCSAVVLAKAEGHGKRGNYIQIRMPSNEIRLLHKECFASIGKISNEFHSNLKIGKAGRNRWLGKRPVVRGKAKNPVDHPHGGGEGGNPIGLKHPKTPWGKPALGYRTRKNKRTNKFIIKRRKK